MPEQQDNQNLPTVPDKKKKSGILKWVLIAIGSLIFSYAISLLWIFLVEKPQEQMQNTGDMLINDTDMIAEEVAEKTPLTETKNDPDSLPRIEELRENEQMKDAMEEEVNRKSIIKTPAAPEQSNTNAQNLIMTDEPASKENPENQQDFKKLAKIYSQMEAKAAAQILTRMNDEMVVGILNEMRDRNAAELLTAFSSVRAARLSRVLSELGT